MNMTLKGSKISKLKFVITTSKYEFGKKAYQFVYKNIERSRQRKLRRLYRQTISIWKFTTATMFGLARDDYGRKKVYVIGDCHSRVFSGYKGFIVKWVGPATAHNLIEK